MESMLCKGFRASGVAAGIKKNQDKDLGLIVSRKPAAAAAVFTKNRVKAAPVLLDMDRIKSGRCSAVIVNSGNANCSTGKQGFEDAVAMGAVAARALDLKDDDVLVSSTGVIGEFLPVHKIKNAMPLLVDELRETGFPDFARAIMTTDTQPKVLSRNVSQKGVEYAIMATAKGAGMIRPDMATMLCFVCTDAKVSPGFLKQALLSSVDISFNRITVDGDTSTNDTVIIMASGESGAVIENNEEKEQFQRVLNALLLDMAKWLVRDGEGVTKLVEIRVKGAVNDEDAQKIADTIAHSPLVKTAFFGEDANWGRIIAAAGRAGTEIDPDKVDLYFDHVLMAKSGVIREGTAEADTALILKKPEFMVTLDLNMGNGNAFMITCDFSVDYVRINADYRS